MSSNLSSKQLRYVSMLTSLFVGLKEDLGLNLSVTKGRSSFLKYHLNRRFLPDSFNSVFSFWRFFFFFFAAVGTNLKPLDTNDIPKSERFLERFITFVLIGRKIMFLSQDVKIFVFL